MNAQSLQAHIDANKDMYKDLAKCGSVAELMVRLAVYGKGWNRWSWAIFIHFLWIRINYSDSYSTGLRQPRSSLRYVDPSCYAMLDDILETIDKSAVLDSVMTNKVIVKTMLQIIDACCGECKGGEQSTCAGLLCVLAHVFAKFPKLWNVSWMYTRHATPRKKAIRTHKLAHLVPVAANRPPEYFESRAFMDDFIYLYWDYIKHH